ncbi:MAG: trypsin-like serine protease [Ruminococcaceae bacterium]|nr:trypsin-like serine protease [Oscillospiraceae bacterium]
MMDEFKNQNENTTENELNDEALVDAPSYEAEDSDTEHIDINNGFNAYDSEDDTVYTDDNMQDMFTAPAVSPQTATWQTVDYSPITDDDKGQSKKGIRVFCLILAVVIVVSGCLFGGYYIGKNSVTGTGGTVDVVLDSKPKDTDEYTAAQVYDAVNQSVVGIRVYNTAGEVSDASGVVYSKDGYIVTNDHIYSEIAAPKFKIYMYDGTEYDAKYVAGDSISDLAVLKIDAKELKVAEFGDSREVVFGESVVAIGRPSDATAASSISKGIISSVSRRMTTTSSYSTNFIQTDSAINPGSSGGALVNMYGQVIGITSSKLAGVNYDAVGFAIPTVTMKRVVEQLISDGSVKDRAKLGISYTEINSVTAEISGKSTVGLLIAEVTEDSDLYGKVTAGSVITHIGGKKITNDDIVLDTLESLKAGDKVTLTVVNQNGVSKDYTVTLKANVGQSSYSDILKDKDDSSSSGGTFDFPYGE